jgi:hypothetical protein
VVILLVVEQVELLMHLEDWVVVVEEELQMELQEPQIVVAVDNLEPIMVLMELVVMVVPVSSSSAT